jgi:hypothetical protein
MGPYQQPTGIYALLQDLYTPQEYNPAEYTLMGYDTGAYLGGVPVGSYDMTAATGPQGSYYATEAQGAMADPAAQNAAVEAAAAANQEAARLRGDVVEWDPSQGIAALQDPFEQERVLREADYRGLIWDEGRKNAWDAMGSQVYFDGKAGRAQRDITYRYGPDGRIKYAQYEGP